MGEDEDKSSTESEKCEGMAVEIVNLTVCEIKKRREEQEISEDELLQRNELLREKYAAILTFSEVEPLSDRMMKLRRLVISEGLPPESDEERACMSTGLRTTLRGTVWKLLLGALHMDSEHYVKLVADGPSWADKKIRDDTFRTFQVRTSGASMAILTFGSQGAAEFRSRVSEVSMARVLNCFVRQNFTADDQTTAGEDGSANNTQNGYVQGMNVLLAPFLFVMPEVDAFFCFNALITRHCPRYVLANLDGTHHGCSLVDRVLNILDPELFAYLHRKSLSATVYAFPMIMTLMASLQPLSEVLRVWDATFAFGVHLDVLLCVCVCMLMRDKLLRDHNPFQYLMPRALSNVTLDAEIIVTCALKLLRCANCLQRPHVILTFPKQARPYCSLRGTRTTPS
jgi:cell cycle arrest protein BUB2